MTSDAARRTMIAAGTENYEFSAEFRLSHVPVELQRICASFAALGYSNETCTTLYDPTASQLRALFADAKRSSSTGDLLVGYYSGHGVRDLERFYLLTRNSDLADLDATAVAAEDLVRLFVKDSNAAQVLLILDACYAGAGAAECAQLANRLASIVGRGPEVFILAAARSKQEAAQDALTQAMARALANADERLGGRAQAFLAAEEVIEAINTYFRDKHPAQTAILSSANVIGRCRLFPNPRHHPAIRAGLDLETQRAFAEHWIPKARGAEFGVSGWYFTGRAQVLRQLSVWLSQDKSGGVAWIVTGGAGCGKSSVLARIVLLADPIYRNELLTAVSNEQVDVSALPPEGVVTVAVHARHKLLSELTLQISSALDLTTQDTNHLLDSISRRQRKTVILVDALDEADEGERITLRLLKPLAALTHVFLLVGTRPDSPESGRRFRGLGDSVVEIDLNDPRYVGDDDVARYVEKRLLAVEEPSRNTPYRTQPELAALVAKVVAGRAGNVFLVAHTAVQALLSEQTVVDIRIPGWVEHLPTGLGEAFDQFLLGLDNRPWIGISAEKARAVLMALALAEGEGLPWADLWAAVSTAVSDLSVSDAEVGRVRKHAAAFIIEAVEHDRSVYRLYHERLAEHLRESVKDPGACHRRVFETLILKVPVVSTGERLDWTRVNPYLLTHLPAHALRGGTIDRLAVDGLFLAAADPSRLLSVLSLARDSVSQRAFACYSLAFDRIHHQSVEERLSYLEMTARQEGDDELANGWRGERLCSWRVPWARCWPVTTHRSISVPHSVSAMSLGAVNKRLLIATAGADQTIRVWDLISGAQFCEPLRGHRGAVTAVSICTLAARMVVVSGGSDNTVRTWDLATSTQRGEPLRGHTDQISAIAVGIVENRPRIFSGSWDGTLRVWDLSSGKQRHEPLLSSNDRITSLGLGELHGKAVIFCGGWFQSPRVWDIETGTASGANKGVAEASGRADRIVRPPIARGLREQAVELKPVQGDRGREDVRRIECVTLANLPDGRSVFVSGGCDHSIRFWDLGSGEQRGKPLLGHADRVSCIATGTFDGRTVIVSGSWDQTVRVWDVVSGAPLGEPLRGHEDRVTAVAVAFVSGRPAIVSAGHDRTVRVWDISSALSARPVITSNQSAVTSVGTCLLGEIPVVVSGGWDCAVHVSNGRTGHQLSSPLTGHLAPVSSLATGEIDGRPIAVSGSYDGTVRVWDIESCVDLHGPMTGHDGQVNSVAIGRINATPIAVSGGVDQTVQVWNLVSGERCAQPQRRPRGRILSLAVGSFETRAVVVSGGDDGTIQLWDIDTGTQVREPSRGHHRPVSSVALGVLDGRSVIVSGGADGTVRLWDMLSGAQRGPPMRGHEDRIRSVALGMLEGKSVVIAGGDDETVRVWDTDGHCMSTVRIGCDVWGLSFVGNDRVVVAARRGLLSIEFHIRDVRYQH